MNTRIIGPILILILSASAQTQAFDALQQAKEAFADGISAFNEEDFSRAATAFRKAYSVNPNWKVQYNIGQSEAANKNHGLALQAFVSYLSRGGDDIQPSRRSEVIAEVERLRKMVGYFEVQAPSKAIISVNGMERGKAPLNRLIPVSAGVEHEVSAVLDGENLPTKSFQVTGGQTITIVYELALKTQDLSPSTESTKSEPVNATNIKEKETPQVRLAADPKKSRRLKNSSWITLGASAALLIAGGITGASALYQNNELEKKCIPSCPERIDDVDKRDAFAAASSTLLGVGAAVGLTGFILLMLSKKEKRNHESDPDSKGLSILPILDSNAAGATLEWRF